jgi:hypothetical protein
MTAEIIRFPKSFQDKVRKAKDELAQHPLASSIKQASATQHRARASKTKPQAPPVSGVQQTKQNTETVTASLGRKNTVWSVAWSLLVLCWPVISFLFWIDVLWHGVLALVFMSTPNTHYGFWFLVHFGVFFILGVSRFLTPKDI